MPADDISSILSRVVETKAEYDIRLLAQQLGTNYRSLMYWLRGSVKCPRCGSRRVALLFDLAQPWR